jgi:hypothetical protein
MSQTEQERRSPSKGVEVVSPRRHVEEFPLSAPCWGAALAPHVIRKKWATKPGAWSLA